MTEFPHFNLEFPVETHNMLFSSFPSKLFSGRLHQVPQVPHCFSTAINPNPHCQFSCGENPEKTTTFGRTGVDELFPRAIRCSIPCRTPTFDLSGVKPPKVMTTISRSALFQKLSLVFL